MLSALRKELSREYRAYVVLLLCFVAAALPARAQEPLQMPPEENSALQERRLYHDAKPYLIDTLPDLQKAVPELRGLDSSATSQDLPSILASVGKAIQDLLSEMPNLICREEVKQTVSGKGSRNSGSRQFNYLILIQRDARDVTMTEYRTDRRNHPIGDFGEDPLAPAARGFVLAWMYFHPTRLAESEFRYLGSQRLDGRKILVVAFAQEPGRVQFPGAFGNKDRMSALLFQGIAWIDASDFRIIRLRTDLLAPQPAARLQKLTTDVDFGEVRVPHMESRLWLPRKAIVEWQTAGSVGGDLLDISQESDAGYRGVEEHTYSNYHVFRVAVNIGPAASHP